MVIAQVGCTDPAVPKRSAKSAQIHRARYGHLGVSQTGRSEHRHGRPRHGKCGRGDGRVCDRSSPQLRSVNGAVTFEPPNGATFALTGSAGTFVIWLRA